MGQVIELSRISKTGKLPQERHSAVRRYFFPGPFLLDPAADLVLIALHGPALGLLGTPPQGVQETADTETTTFEILRASGWPHRTPPAHRKDIYSAGVNLQSNGNMYCIDVSVMLCKYFGFLVGCSAYFKVQV